MVRQSTRSSVVKIWRAEPLRKCLRGSPLFAWNFSALSLHNSGDYPVDASCSASQAAPQFVYFGSWKATTVLRHATIYGIVIAPAPPAHHPPRRKAADRTSSRHTTVPRKFRRNNYSLFPNLLAPPLTRAVLIFRNVSRSQKPTTRSPELAWAVAPRLVGGTRTVAVSSEPDESRVLLR